MIVFTCCLNMFKVGVPAKSAISGVTMVVIPNVTGMALWSPNLDDFNNSVRATMFCQELVKRYALHRYRFNQNKPSGAYRKSQ